MADEEKRCVNCKHFRFYKVLDSEGECEYSTTTVHPLDGGCDKFESKQYDRETTEERILHRISNDSPDTENDFGILVKEFLSAVCDSTAMEMRQIMLERDQAMEQLKANGLRFGHKDDYGWIPISERLPEDGERVLYCYKGHEYGGIRVGTSVIAGWWVKHNLQM